MPETWRDPKVDPPPKDGRTFVLSHREKDGWAIIVRWKANILDPGSAFREIFEDYQCWSDDYEHATWVWCPLPEVPDA